MLDVRDFIQSFEPSGVGRVAFAWNGKHADELRDANLDFRREVVKEVLANPEAASVELLRALVDAETALAKEAWGTNLWVHSLAEHMLIRGGASAVNDFLYFWYRGMDAHCELSRVSLPASVAQKCAAFCVQRLANSASDREQTLYEEGAKFFGALAKGAG